MVDGLNFILIQLISNPKVHQLIDIAIVDIREAYDILPSRGWSQELQSYFHNIGLIYGFHAWISKQEYN